MTSDRKIVTKVNANGDTIRRERDRSVASMRKYAGNFEWHDYDCVYNTATGHYDIKAGEYYRYVRDRLGSTVAVTDGAGNLVQATGYYPSGTPYKLPASVATDIDAVTEKLHIGNKWIGHKGFDIYDNTARMHDPLLARFHTIDPLFGDYPGNSPWSHCAANPANILDPDGRDTLSVNNEGYISLVRPTEDNFDILIGREGNYLKIDKGNLEEIAREKRTKDNKTCFVFLYDIKDNDKAKNLFKFLAQNTNVEWSLVHIPNNNYLGTTHQETFDYTIDVILKGQTLDSLREMTYFCHSHTLASYASPTDIGLIEQLNALDICPYTEIYFVPKDKYIHYDSSGSNLLEIEIKSHRP